jgi:hypothetical protein
MICFLASVLQGVCVCVCVCVCDRVRDRDRRRNPALEGYDDMTSVTSDLSKYAKK